MPPERWAMNKKYRQMFDRGGRVYYDKQMDISRSYSHISVERNTRKSYYRFQRVCLWGCDPGQKRLVWRSHKVLAFGREYHPGLNRFIWFPIPWLTRRGHLRQWSGPFACSESGGGDCYLLLCLVPMSRIDIALCRWVYDHRYCRNPCHG